MYWGNSFFWRGTWAQMRPRGNKREWTCNGLRLILTKIRLKKPPKIVVELMKTFLQHGIYVEFFGWLVRFFLKHKVTVKPSRALVSHSELIVTHESICSSNHTVNNVCFFVWLWLTFPMYKSGWMHISSNNTGNKNWMARET